MRMGGLKRDRPRMMPSQTHRLRTEHGNLFITVSLDEHGQPFELFGFLGKGGSFHRGVTEMACRLISLHLRRGTPLKEIVEQIRGISEMQPWPNQLGDGTTVTVLGLGDGIGHVLQGFIRDDEEVRRYEPI